jgi:hypothetical protein
MRVCVFDCALNHSLLVGIGSNQTRKPVVFHDLPRGGYRRSGGNPLLDLAGRSFGSQLAVTAAKQREQQDER